MGKKPTANDVARVAGVSASTVDRVLNNRGGVDNAKETAVLAAAKRLGLDRALNFRAARTLRVSAFIQSPDNPFHAALGAAIHAENHGENPYNIQIRVAYVDPRKPDDLLRKVTQTAKGDDGIIICVPQDERLNAVLMEMIAAGKPVVAVATDIRCRGAIYVGPDNRQAGRLAGDLMGRLLGASGGDILVIAGVLSMVGQVERLAGFEAVLNDRYPGCRILSRGESLDQGDVAGDIAYRALADFPQLRGIYNAAVGAVPVAQAVISAGRGGDLVLITHELTSDRRLLLRNGTVDAVIDQNPALEIRTALRRIAGHYGRDGIMAEPNGFTPLQIFMRENA